MSLRFSIPQRWQKSGSLTAKKQRCSSQSDCSRDMRRLYAPLRKCGISSPTPSIEAEFSGFDADNFYSSFAKDDREIIATTLANMPSNRDEEGRLREFKDFDAKDKLSICIVTLRAAIISAQRQTVPLLAPRPEQRSNSQTQ
ncbi:hypothetical protein FHT77_000932 [Rhizobium sp. BK181]|uniref:hypothetical protein n=1 Tax=Rhizobium sp. BK181 TaxID=2587072 RepID=UPI0017E7324A|nr:hypothetical protein [Rhizobium sp. BK181]MBB3315090.1 hypothetical protein [Rhizobium sp. BK181]